MNSNCIENWHCCLGLIFYSFVSKIL